jgi:hypothetical protein
MDPVATSYQELQSQFTSLYESGRRLPHRIYWDEALGTYRGETSDGSVISVPADFLGHLRTEIELALQRGYGDFVYYSDLGHGHLLFPEKEAGLAEGAALWEKALRSPDAKVLYHTAELLQMRNGYGPDAPLPQDPWLAWRYFSRNVLADNGTGENLAVLFAAPPAYNTVRSVDGYRELGTFLLSSSKDGCLSYRQNGKVYYFDLAFRR